MLVHERICLKREEMNAYKKQDELLDSTTISKTSPGEMIGSEGLIKKKACSSVWTTIVQKKQGKSGTICFQCSDVSLDNLKVVNHLL